MDAKYQKEKRMMKYREALFDDKIQDNFTTNLFITRNRQQNNKPKSAHTHGHRGYRPPAHVSQLVQGSKDVVAKQEMNGIVNKFLTQVKRGDLIELDDLEEECQ